MNETDLYVLTFGVPAYGVALGVLLGAIVGFIEGRHRKTGWALLALVVGTLVILGGYYGMNNYRDMLSFFNHVR